jgi:hypothetical protein
MARWRRLLLGSLTRLPLPTPRQDWPPTVSTNRPSLHSAHREGNDVRAWGAGPSAGAAFTTLQEIAVAAPLSHRPKALPPVGHPDSVLRPRHWLALALRTSAKSMSRLLRLVALKRLLAILCILCTSELGTSSRSITVAIIQHRRIVGAPGLATTTPPLPACGSLRPRRRLMASTRHGGVQRVSARRASGLSSK